jgi:hypothetical protein
MEHIRSYLAKLVSCHEMSYVGKLGRCSNYSEIDVHVEHCKADIIKVKN